MIQKIHNTLNQEIKTPQDLFSAFAVGTAIVGLTYGIGILILKGLSNSLARAGYSSLASKITLSPLFTNYWFFMGITLGIPALYLLIHLRQKPSLTTEEKKTKIENNEKDNINNDNKKEEKKIEIEKSKENTHDKNTTNEKPIDDNNKIEMRDCIPKIKNKNIQSFLMERSVKKTKLTCNDYLNNRHKTIIAENAFRKTDFIDLNSSKDITIVDQFALYIGHDHTIKKSTFSDKSDPMNQITDSYRVPDTSLNEPWIYKFKVIDRKIIAFGEYKLGKYLPFIAIFSLENTTDCFIIKGLDSVTEYCHGVYENELFIVSQAGVLQKWSLEGKLIKEMVKFDDVMWKVDYNYNKELIITETGHFVLITPNRIYLYHQTWKKASVIEMNGLIYNHSYNNGYLAYSQSIPNTQEKSEIGMIDIEKRKIVFKQIQQEATTVSIFTLYGDHIFLRRTGELSLSTINWKKETKKEVFFEFTIKVANEDCLIDSIQCAGGILFIRASTGKLHSTFAEKGIMSMAFLDISSCIMIAVDINSREPLLCQTTNHHTDRLIIDKSAKDILSSITYSDPLNKNKLIRKYL